MWDKASDRDDAGTIAIQKLIRYLPTPAFNDRCQYCTSSINPSVTCAEHLITCKSLPIHSPEHICTAIENFEDSVFELSEVISSLLFSFNSASCVPFHAYVYYAYPMTDAMRLWTLIPGHFSLLPRGLGMRLESHLQALATRKPGSIETDISN